MNRSKCPVCGSSHSVKNGMRKGVQTYKCRDCGYQFRNSKIPNDMKLWHSYQDKKQTVEDLAASYGVSVSTIKRRLRNITIEWEQPPLSGSGFVNLDATYWRRNNGVLVGLDSLSGSVLYVAFIKHESMSDYQEALTSIEKRGYKIKGMIIDGQKKLFSLFSQYKIQMCQFHMKQIIRRYLTLNHRLLAARALNDLVYDLPSKRKDDFRRIGQIAG